MPPTGRRSAYLNILPVQTSSSNKIMTTRRTGCIPIFLPKVHAQSSWLCKFKSAAGPAGVPLHRPRRTQNAASARRGSATAASNKAAEAPPPYGTSSAEDRALAVAKDAERHAAQVADGAAGGLDLCGCAGHRGQKTADRCPTGARRTGWLSSSGDRKDAVWKAPRVRPSVRPHVDVSEVPPVHSYTEISIHS
jgi:hypothetical protein